MGQSRSHHFVPQFYLRRFSDDGRSIRVLNKASDRIIERAPIKGQCAVDNLHGWHEDAEQTLSVIESDCAVTIDELLRTGIVPQRGSPDHTNILVFVALQHGRTVAHGEINSQFTDHFWKQILRGRPELSSINLDDYVIRDEHPVALPMITSLKAFDYLSSLDAVLLSSGEQIGFITSDNPVVLYNSMRSEVWWEGVVGLDCEGLQVFLPLSQQTCLYLFDRAAYANASNTIGRRASIEDVLKVNALTILNSHKNIYGANTSDLEIARNLRGLTKPFEGFDRAAFNKTESYEDDHGGHSAIIAIYEPHVPASFEFRFARIRRGRDLDGIRSDRLAAARRKRISNSPTVRQLEVVSSTLEGPRKMVRDNDVRRLARRFLPVTQSTDTCLDHRQTPARRHRVAAEARGSASDGA
jgi:hypothetical protein